MHTLYIPYNAKDLGVSADLWVSYKGVKEDGRPDHAEVQAFELGEIKWTPEGRKEQNNPTYEESVELILNELESNLEYWQQYCFNHFLEEG